jgi:hypothetical protein
LIVFVFWGLVWRVVRVASFSSSLLPEDRKYYIYSIMAEHGSTAREFELAHLTETRNSAGSAGLDLSPVESGTHNRNNNTTTTSSGSNNISNINYSRAPRRPSYDLDDNDIIGQGTNNVRFIEQYEENDVISAQRHSSVPKLTQEETQQVCMLIVMLGLGHQY